MLAAGLARVRPGCESWFAERPENFTLVSWTSLLYDFRRDIALDLPGIERLLESPHPTREQRREIDSLARFVARQWHVFGDSFPWLTRFIASPALKLTLADVHRYLGDADGVGGRIRELLKTALAAARAAGERVLLVGHSLGSVIAYDTLWELSRDAGVATTVDLLTLGSPLATRFIRRSLKGAGLPLPERYPAMIARWHNMTARAEMVALHPRLEPFFAPMIALGLTQCIEDRVDIYNHFQGPAGLDVHKSYGYLNHAAVAGFIGDWIASDS